jgi:hypothetical protein
MEGRAMKKWQRDKMLEWLSDCERVPKTNKEMRFVFGCLFYNPESRLKGQLRRWEGNDGRKEICCCGDV